MTLNQHETRAERLDGIQMLRGLAALSVVLFHFSIIETIYGPDRITPDLFQYGHAGVDLFFVISGYIMVHVTRALPSGGASAGSFLLRRLRRIYPPYWVVTLGMLLLWAASSGSAFNGLVGENRNVAASLALWPEGHDPVLSVGWTLVHEVYFYLVFTLILLAPQTWRLPLLTVWGALMAGFNLAGANHGSPEAALATNPLNLEFLMGAAIAYLRPRLGEKYNPAAWALAAAFMAGAFLFWGPAPKASAFSLYWARALLLGPCAACLVFLFTSPNRAAPAILTRLGDWSYALYLLHIPVFAVLGSVWRKTAMNGPADNILALFVMSGAAIASAGLFYTWIEQPLLRVQFAPLRPKAAA